MSSRRSFVSTFHQFQYKLHRSPDRSSAPLKPHRATAMLKPGRCNRSVSDQAPTPRKPGNETFMRLVPGVDFWSRMEPVPSLLLLEFTYA